MNDQAANRLLKTLEEPPAFVHLILLTDRREDVLATIASRCQPVRFDPPPRGADRRGLDGRRGAARAGVRAAGARRRAAGGAARRRAGWALRAGAEALRARGARGRDGRAPVDGAAGGGAGRGRGARERAQRALAERAGAAAARRSAARRARGAGGAPQRAERRARTRALDQACGSPGCGCATCCASCEGAQRGRHAVDRRAELRRGRARRDAARCARAVELVQDTRLRLQLNVSEELALEALAYRLEALLAAVGPSARRPCGARPRGSGL